MEGMKRIHIASIRARPFSGARGGDHLLSLCRVDRERFLAEHMPACLEAEYRVVPVAGVGCSYIYGVYFVVAGQFLIAAVRPGEPELGGEPFCPLEASRADSREFRALGLLQGRGEFSRDPPGPEDPPSDLSLSSISFIRVRRSPSRRGGY